MSVADSEDNTNNRPHDMTNSTAATGPVPGYKNKSVWLRGLFMLLFIIFFGIGEFLLVCVAVLQFLWLLFTQEPNDHLKRFGQSLSIWLRETALYQACTTKDKPFPWAPWPKSE